MQQQSPEQPSPPASNEHNIATVQEDYAVVAKKESGSPSSLIDSDEATHLAAVDFAKPETERQRLKTKIGTLQAQVEDLHRQIDLFKQHAATKDAQYLQIIEQSTGRELQGVADSERWRADRKQWADERQMLQDTIAGLNSRLGELRNHFSPGKSSGNPAQVAVHSLAGEHDYFTKLVTHPFPQAAGMAATQRPLRSGAETPLDHLQYESGQLAEYSTKLVEIGRNIRMQLDLMRDAAP